VAQPVSQYILCFDLICAPSDQTVFILFENICAASGGSD
jgi:hypothetical protein